MLTTEQNIGAAAKTTKVFAAPTVRVARVKKMLPIEYTSAAATPIHPNFLSSSTTPEKLLR